MFLTCLLSACIKEYSFEAQPVQDTIPVTDSVPDNDTLSVDTSFLYSCNACLSDTTSSSFRWSFINGTARLCGEITSAVLAPEKTAFTFFGPSDCSADSGLIMTVYLNPGDTLNSDKTNITAGFTYFEYYDNTTYVDALQSAKDPPFYLVIDSFNNTTRIAKGKFAGTAISKDGKETKISSGSYCIHL